MLAVFWQNSRHPAVFTSGETGRITVELDKIISEISARFRGIPVEFQKEFTTTFSRNTAQISPKNSDKVIGGIQVEFRWHYAEFHWNSDGVPLEFSRIN